MMPRKAQPSWVQVFTEDDFSHYAVAYYSFLFSLSYHGWEDISQMELENIVMHHSKVDHCDIKYLSFFH